MPLKHLLDDVRSCKPGNGVRYPAEALHGGYGVSGVETRSMTDCESVGMGSNPISHPKSYYSVNWVVILTTSI